MTTDSSTSLYVLKVCGLLCYFISILLQMSNTIVRVKSLCHYHKDEGQVGFDNWCREVANLNHKTCSTLQQLQAEAVAQGAAQWY